ncbi:MAG: transcriptional regulator AlsR family [Firmicutes bacterium]|nr:transcriptional regulator AlsR family [Bacillota bacterium]
MDIRQLQYFISVAEHLSFTVAAKHHFIAQTAISQQIQAMEKKLGVRLFTRNSRSVQLTPAGTVFLKEAKLLVSIATDAIKKTQNAASDSIGSLKIGFLGPNEKYFLPELIHTIRRKYPGIDLTFTQNTADTINEYLARGLLDLAFSECYDQIEQPGDFEWKTISSHPICATLHVDHPLATQSKIDLLALAKEPFVAIDSLDYHAAYEHLVAFCARQGGFIPKIVSQHRTPETVLLMIEARVGISLLPQFLAFSGNPNLRFIELTGERAWVHSTLVWRKNNNNQLIPLLWHELQNVLSCSPDNLANGL